MVEPNHYTKLCRGYIIILYEFFMMLLPLDEYQRFGRKINSKKVQMDIMMVMDAFWTEFCDMVHKN